jgi:hypothetical protein
VARRRRKPTHAEVAQQTEDALARSVETLLRAQKQEKVTAAQARKRAAAVVDEQRELAARAEAGDL